MSPARPLHWLRLGWADLMRCPLPGLLHGLAAVVFGGALLLLAGDSFWLLAGAFSGFLIVAPLVATGLYAISRSLELGQRPDLATAFAAWRPRDSRLVIFGLLLALAGTGWVLTSAALITTFAGSVVNSPADFLRVVVLADDDRHLFEAWLVLGAILAAPIFVSSVVAIPLLLDRGDSVLDAVATSVAATLASPVALALWATLILALTMLGMASLMLGLIVLLPWLAHASWHAYRDLVGPDDGARAA
ncbi:DUF2189 domain-containing protein [Piscinibacter sakaiensis]|uniref:DUF2189 domain-containing protein n=1 Tax=Piscinibacter sakaiensis TaxID=1547922 RepID=UPI003AAFA206